MRNSTNGQPKRPLNIGEIVKVKCFGTTKECKIKSWKIITETDKDDVIVYTDVNDFSFDDSQVVG